jgi:hypothetical protein
VRRRPIARRTKQWSAFPDFHVAAWLSTGISN